MKDVPTYSFINGTNWEDEVTAIDRMAKLTKEDIVAFADKYLKEDNYAVVYKKQGKDPNEKKMTKPEITPIVSNRDVASPFLTSIQENAARRTRIPRLQERYEPADSEIRYSGTL